MVNAVAVLGSNEGVSGTIYFTQEADGSTTVTGNISGLKPGLHGFHVHALGDTTNGCMSTGIVQRDDVCFFVSKASSPRDHISILLAKSMVLLRMRIGMLVILEMSLLVMMGQPSSQSIIDKQIPLSGPNSIIGRAVVVHGD